jgi:hypothetical protein
MNGDIQEESQRRDRGFKSPPLELGRPPKRVTYGESSFHTCLILGVEPSFHVRPAGPLDFSLV